MEHPCRREGVTIKQLEELADTAMACAICCAVFIVALIILSLAIRGVQ